METFQPKYAQKAKQYLIFTYVWICWVIRVVNQLCITTKIRHRDRQTIFIVWEKHSSFFIFNKSHRMGKFWSTSLKKMNVTTGLGFKPVAQQDKWEKSTNNLIVCNTELKLRRRTATTLLPNKYSSLTKSNVESTLIFANAI